MPFVLLALEYEIHNEIHICIKSKITGYLNKTKQWRNDKKETKY
jgi:hypothetical protein